MPTDLVAIQSATKTPNHMRRNVLIGIILGTATFLLITTFAATFVMRRWRRRKITQLRSEAVPVRAPSQEPRRSNDRLAQEIGHNSLVGPFRELSDNAKARAELLNEQAPSGSGKEIPEMSDALPIISHELGTNRSSPVMAQTRTADRWKIFAPTKSSTKSWTSFASSDRAPCPEIIVSASQRKETETEKESIVNANIEAEIHSLYTRRSLDLNRSLPPTPISESPQMSPVLGGFNGSSSPFCHRPQVVKSSVRGSLSALVSPEMPLSIYPATYSKNQRLPLSDLLTGLETLDGSPRAPERQLVEKPDGSERRA